MAKRGRKKKVVFRYKNQLTGIFLIILSILGFGNFGIVGKFIHWVTILLVGSLLCYVLLTGLIVIGLVLLVKDEDADLFSTRFIGAYLLFLGAVILFHRGFFTNGNNAMFVFNDTMNHIIDTFKTMMSGGEINNYFYCGGGIIGGVLAIIFVKLFSMAGMYIISGLLILFGLFMIIGFDFFGTISEKFVEGKEKIKEKIDASKDDDDEDDEEDEKEKELTSTAIITGLHKDTQADNQAAQPVIVKSEPQKKEVVVNENYQLPSIDLLDEIKKDDIDDDKQQDAINENIQHLENVLKDFNITATVKEVHVGPTVAQYELEVASGTRVNKITSINREIALELAKKDVRIEAPIPGKRTVGIEFANDHPRSVSFREIIDSNEMKSQFDQKLLVPLGKSIMGDIGTCRIDKMPHLLIAGTTGSGKSVCVNGIICSILMRAKPDEVKLAMVDPKVVELSVYNDIPHLMCPVVNDPKEASVLLQKMVQEMERRYHQFSDSGTKNIESYNDYIDKENKKNSEKKKRMPYIVIIIDELSDLMMVAAKDVEDSILRITQKARAAGMHLIVATQRPSTEVITGLIKANIPSRIAFAVGSGIDSRTILDMVGAEKLLGKGDMLYMPIGTNTPTRIQGSFITDDEIKRICDHVKSQQEAQYDATLENLSGASSGGAGININDLDPLYDEVVDLITSTNKASASMIQRKFKVGYNRDGRIIDELEETGVIRKPDGSNNWEVVGRQDLTPQPEVETITIDQAREQLTSDEKMDFTQNVEIKYEEKDEDDKLIADEEDDGENLLDEVENS